MGIKFWWQRPKVKDCPHNYGCNCPTCGNNHCEHEDGEVDCTEDDCPLFDGKRWKPYDWVKEY